MCLICNTQDVFTTTKSGHGFCESCSNDVANSLHGSYQTLDN